MYDCLEFLHYMAPDLSKNLIAYHDPQSDEAKRGQLSLNFDDDVHSLVTEQSTQTSEQPIIKTMLFPRHLSLPQFGQIQAQLSQALAPFGIEVEFRFTRQNRLEMKWLFPPQMRRSDIQAFSTVAGLTTLTQPAADLTDEEKAAFSDILLEVAD